MINLRRIIMKENRVGFFAGCAGGFGFYIAWMILVMLWQTTTTEDSAMKSVIGFFLGLVVGVLLYLGVYFLANKRLQATISKHITRYTILGIVAGLVIAFLFGNLFYNPTGIGFTPIFPLD
jgi:glucan phosphoethanolaminetransferase (alkaline phosphatase superfamily)